MAEYTTQIPQIIIGFDIRRRLNSGLIIKFRRKTKMDSRKGILPLPSNSVITAIGSHNKIYEIKK